MFSPIRGGRARGQTALGASAGGSEQLIPWYVRTEAVRLAGSRVGVRTDGRT